MHRSRVRLHASGRSIADSRDPIRMDTGFCQDSMCVRGLPTISTVRGLCNRAMGLELRANTNHNVYPSSDALPPLLPRWASWPTRES